MKDLRNYSTCLLAGAVMLVKQNMRIRWEVHVTYKQKNANRTVVRKPLEINYLKDQEKCGRLLQKWNYGNRL
jgi:hypothetical protein